MNNDPFDIIDEYVSTVTVYGFPTGSINSPPDSTSSQSSMTIEVGSPTSSSHMIDDNQLESQMTCLPPWDVNTFEVVGSDVGNPSIG